ncbi:arylsulfatase [Fusarium albosuccineum]|uniref:Arylsulfatase n=1 Tax=Fusarium albosuccineum TaxID=1237068 RepID=A0A8H4L6J3_9HYPO|nr:arylsulfatase [Fusarium albosuccineum]
MSGKWHLGLKPEHFPSKRGFEKSFALLPGCSNHYGWEPEYDDPSTEPGGFLEMSLRALHVEDDRYLNSLPQPWYSSDSYAEKLINYLKERTPEYRDKPFFAYLPFSAPHWPLQAPVENMAKYKGIYADGPAKLRLARLQRLKELHLIAPDIEPHPVVALPAEQQEWDALDDETRQKSARAMETYAGMVDRMDWNIGRVLDFLKQEGEFDNTLIMFMSDNGAEGASYEALPIMGEKIMANIAKYYDNSLDNIGRQNSFVWYGSRWAQAATASSRLFKMFSTEGGCRVPLIVKPPSSGTDKVGREDRKPTESVITDAFCTVMDIVPTILDLAGVSHPVEYKGRAVAQLRGRSWKPFLENVVTESRPGPGIAKIPIHDPDYVAGFEIAGSGALRRGDYKITFVPVPRGPQRWELFNIRKDPGEVHDLSQKEPKLFAEMLALWDKYKEEVGVVGLAGEFARPTPGGPSPGLVDEVSDPYAWIKYVGRPEITPKQLIGVVPDNVK